MEKKAYIIPGIQVITVELHRLMGQFSGGGDKEDDPQVDPNPDTGTDDNRSRSTHNVWDEEEEDY